MTDVRVRIAPSPTGPMHVGTAYQAVFNRVWAQQNKGQFVLRIEDTDQARSHKKYEDELMQSLRWLGLRWDEGPDVGGPYGPYRQSERLSIYAEYAAKLVDSGHAYLCFCTSERLAALRKEQQERKEHVGYDGHCRELSAKEVEAKIQAGCAHVIRLKMPREGACEVKDMLREPISLEWGKMDDQVLMKSDGFPTYHLAVVVDDHLMRISHVIRGEEWITSTPKHLRLYEAFGWTPPTYMHLPLLLNPDGSKMSKRRNPTSVEYYRRAGYVPSALLNYLALMAYPPIEDEKFTLKQLAEHFDPAKINLGGSIFDIDKLGWLNGRYLREDRTPEASVGGAKGLAAQRRIRGADAAVYAAAAGDAGGFCAARGVFLRPAGGARGRGFGAEKAGGRRGGADVANSRVGLGRGGGVGQGRRGRGRAPGGRTLGVAGPRRDRTAYCRADWRAGGAAAV